MPRLFFAAWPDDAAADALGRLAGDAALVCDGRPVPRAKIHLTLAFLGEVPGERVADAGDAARALRFAPFDLVADRVGSFRRARVAWAGMSEAPAPLVDLQGALAAGLVAAGFALESRPYAPHATLVRRIAKPLPMAAVAPIRWTARAFTLVRSLGGRYEVIEEYRAG